MQNVPMHQGKRICLLLSVGSIVSCVIMNQQRTTSSAHYDGAGTGSNRTAARASQGSGLSELLGRRFQTSNQQVPVRRRVGEAPGRHKTQMPILRTSHRLPCSTLVENTWRVQTSSNPSTPLQGMGGHPGGSTATPKHSPTCDQHPDRSSDSRSLRRQACHGPATAHTAPLCAVWGPHRR